MNEFVKLEKMLLTGKISRREFLSYAAALGMTAAVSPLLFSTKAIAAAPQKGGTLRIGISEGETIDNLDPAMFKSSFVNQMSYLIHDKLFELNTDSIPRGEIAESWESSSDLKRWTFAIRKGVEFHNGKELDANDVIASLNYHRKENSKSPLKNLLKPVVDIKPDGKYTVVINLKEAWADFPHILCMKFAVICPAKGDGIDWESRVGSGPYVLKEFEPGVQASFEKNPRYWDSNIGYFNQVTIHAIQDNSARTTALITKKIDIMDQPDLRTIDKLSTMPGIKVEEVAGPGHMSFPMLTDVPPFDNNDFRLALKHAINRDALLKNLFAGHGTLGNDQPISSAYQFYGHEIPQRQYDPDKAKFYLKKTSYAGEEIQFFTADTGGVQAVDSAMLYQQHAAKAGINIKVVRVSNDGYWANIWRKKPWCSCWWAGSSSEDMHFTRAYAAESSTNDTNWKHERFNKLLVDARGEKDNAKRREMYVEMQKIVRDEGGQVIPIFFNNVIAYNDKLKHLPGLHAINLLDGHQIGDRWWFES